MLSRTRFTSRHIIPIARIGTFLALMLVLLAVPSMTQAQGVIVPGVSTDPDWLSVDFHRVDVEIDNQIARTTVEMQFTNNGEQLAEGTFLFPLPQGAAVEELIMYINDQAIEAKILRADEARAIYDEIVRQYRDPALLEYVGSDLIQANVFPIPPGEFRKIRIEYGQLITAENGLFKYVYPLHTGTAVREVDEMSIRVHVTSNQELSNVYSPSHGIALSRPDDFEFTAGFERNFYTAEDDFTLYYATRNESIDLNVLSYRESANQDGFFLTMVQPPFTLDDAQIQPKDVVIVLDQSGSMEGQKWEQAREASLYVLDNLNPRDRFNVVTFSTGWRIYANDMLPASEASGAKDWLRGMYPDGGTDIYGGLSTALDFADSERSLTVIFLTDGLATEGIVETDQIMDALTEDAPRNARIFTFGVGDDVDTFLLDQIVRDFKGAGSYVRPSERIDEEVATLYNKISAPVMTDIEIIWDGVTPEWVYPRNLPDLFAGEQLTIVGRYRNSESNVTITLSGIVNGQRETLTYTVDGLQENAGGESFLGRLWATRRIGDLLNNIRLNGEDPELVESVVNLSIRYGIITPYTSFLIEEDDILSQSGRDAAFDDFAAEAEELANDFTGASAVDAADTALGLSEANAPMAMPTMQSNRSGSGSGASVGGAAPAEPMDMDMAEDDGFVTDEETGEGFASEPSVNPVQYVGDKTFLLQGDIWTDTLYNPDTMDAIEVVFLSDAYFDLLEQFPDAGAYLAIGEQVIVVLDGQAYEVVAE
jgi:Ca-activated chloride channel family protein